MRDFTRDKYPVTSGPDFHFGSQKTSVSEKGLGVLSESLPGFHWGSSNIPETRVGTRTDDVSSPPERHPEDR